MVVYLESNVIFRSILIFSQQVHNENHLVNDENNFKCSLILILFKKIAFPNLYGNI